MTDRYHNGINLAGYTAALNADPGYGTMSHRIERIVAAYAKATAADDTAHVPVLPTREAVEKAAVAYSKAVRTATRAACENAQDDVRHRLSAKSDETFAALLALIPVQEDAK